MPRIHANNFETTLNGAILSSATSMTLTSVTGFPAIGAGVTCNVTLEDGATTEIVKCTAISGFVVTIVRAQESTSASDFGNTAIVSLRATRDSIDTKQDALSGLSVTAVTVATNDKVLIQDTSDSNNLKTVTAQAIADLAAASSVIGVANGGTGLTSLTTYSVLCGGTTSTGNVQQVSGLGTTGQVLTSNGTGALPTWQAVSSGSGALTGITSISDTNGHAQITFSATTSAVNALTITNAATGNSPVINATGSDTNIYTYIQGKGNRGVVIGAGVGASRIMVGTPGSGPIDIWNGASSDGGSLAVGSNALGNASLSGIDNTAFGMGGVGQSLTSGSNNLFVAYSSGSNATTGSNNVLAGMQTGSSNATGGANLTTGSDNTLIGYRASIDTNSAAGCIALGSNAVAAKSTGSTSSDHGAGIAVGSAAIKVGFRGDGTIYSAVGASAGYWRLKINGTVYKIQLFADV